jgi:hypothetical protein
MHISETILSWFSRPDRDLEGDMGKLHVDTETETINVSLDDEARTREKM